MSMRKPKVCFGGWSLWDLNPGNYSIKNDFIENLLFMGSQVAGIARILGDNVRIVKGFEPMSKNPDATKFEKHHASCSAIALSWDSYEKEKTKNDPNLRLFIDNQTEHAISVVLYDDMIRFIQDNRACIYEIVDNKDRVIYRK